MRCLMNMLLAAMLAAPARAVAAEPAATQSSGASQRASVALTVYNDDLGLVRETRALTLPTGDAALRFMDVAARIDPRTVHIGSLTSPSALRVLEQNYEYDLISPDKLMEKFVGRQVTLVFPPPEAGAGRERQVDARLVSTNGGMVYEIDGQYHVNPPARVILPEIPGGLISVPTLVWHLRNAGPAAHTIEASYLTGGVGWSADYIVSLDAKDSRADLNGWVTITNESGASYADATLKLVAGDVHRARREAPEMRMTAMAVDAAAPQIAEEAFFEYHMYTVERPVTVKDRQTKQVALMEASGVPIRKTYLLAGQSGWYRSKLGLLGREMKVGVFLEFDNAQKGGLGIPLPAGVVRMYKKDSAGSLQFVGEDSIKHTPKDETVILKAGDAFDVVADRVQTDYRAVAGGRYDIEVEFEIKIRNHKEEAVTVTVREPMSGDWKVLTSTHPAQRKDAATLEFSVPVARDAEAVLRYRVAIDWG